jgi:hypothetical protein
MPELGLAGRVREAGTTVFFTSRKADGELAARITAADGTVLYEYREFDGETVWVEAKDGSRVELPRSPELRIRGALYGPSTPEQLAALRSLATSREGDLIRRLGLGLVVATPGPELVDERRGLEMATQALWPYFHPGGQFAPPFTADYEVGTEGYVVLTQPVDLVLTINHTRPEASKGLQRAWEKHDDDQVNGCLGRCGSGCTGGFLGYDIYESHWTDTTVGPTNYHQEVRCVSGSDWVYTWYLTTTTHSVTGLWAPGCQLHDSCCRISPLLCYSLYCTVFVPEVAVDIYNDPEAEVRTWTYTSYYWSIATYSLGYSGCTCPGSSPTELEYECTQ